MLEIVLVAEIYITSLVVKRQFEKKKATEISLYFVTLANLERLLNI